MIAAAATNAAPSSSAEAAPRLASVSPVLVVAGAGEALQVRGVNLSDVHTVTIGERTAPFFTEPALGTLWVQVPADLPAGSYLLRVHNPRGSSNGVLIQVLVTRLSGRIVHSGLPVAGHPVYLARRTDAPSDKGLSPVASVETAADGTFVFESVSPGSYWLIAPKGAAGGALHRYEIEVEISSGRPIQDVGTIDLWAELELSLHLGGETRVAAGELQVNLAEWRGDRPLTFLWTTHTELAGGKAFLHIARPEAPLPLLSVEALEGAAFLDERARRTVEPGTYQSFIELTAGAHHVWITGPTLRIVPGAVQGRILAGDRPLAGEAIFLERGGRRVEAARLGSGGEFRLGGGGDGLPAGKYWLRLQRAGEVEHEIVRPISVGAFDPEIELPPWEIERERAALASLRFKASTRGGEERQLAGEERLFLNGPGLAAHPVVLAAELPAARGLVLEVWESDGRRRVQAAGGRLVIGREWVPEPGVYPTRLRISESSAPGAEVLVAGPNLEVRPAVLGVSIDESVLLQGELRLFGPGGEVPLVQEGGALVARGVQPGEYRVRYAAHGTAPGELESLERSFSIGIFEPVREVEFLRLAPFSVGFTLRFGEGSVDDGQVVNQEALTEATPLVLTWEPIADARASRIVVVAGADEEEEGDERASAGGGAAARRTEETETVGWEVAWDHLPSGEYGSFLEIELDGGRARYRGPQFTVATGSVRGRAVVAGKPLMGSVRLHSRSVSESVRADAAARDQKWLWPQPLAADGTFSLEPIPPGDYLLEVRSEVGDERAEARVSRIAIPVRIAAVGRTAGGREGVAVDIGTLHFDVESEFLYTVREFRTGTETRVQPDAPFATAPGATLGVRVSLPEKSADETEEVFVALDLFDLPVARWHARGERLQELAGEYRLSHHGDFRAVLTRRLSSGAWVEVEGPAVRIVPPGGAPGWRVVYVTHRPPPLGRTLFPWPQGSTLFAPDRLSVSERGRAELAEALHFEVDGWAGASATLPLPSPGGAGLTVELSLAHFGTVTPQMERSFTVVIDDGVKQASFTLPAGPQRASGGYHPYRFVIAGDEAFGTGPGWHQRGRIVEKSRGVPAITFGFLASPPPAEAEPGDENGNALSDEDRSDNGVGGAPLVAEAYVHYVAVSTDGAFLDANVLPSPDFAPAPADFQLGIQEFEVRQGEKGTLTLTWAPSGEVKRAWVYVRERDSGRMVVAFPRELTEPPAVAFASLPVGEFDVGVALIGTRGATTAREEALSVPPYWSEVTTGRGVFGAWRSGGWAVFTIGDELALSAERGHSAWVSTPIPPGATAAGVTVEVVARGPDTEGIFEIAVNDGRGEVSVAWERDMVSVAGERRSLPGAERAEARYRVTAREEEEGVLAVQLYRDGIALFPSPRRVDLKGAAPAEKGVAHLILRQRHPIDAATDSSFITLKRVYVSTAGAFSPVQLRAEPLEGSPELDGAAERAGEEQTERPR